MVTDNLISWTEWIKATLVRYRQWPLPSWSCGRPAWRAVRWRGDGRRRPAIGCSANDRRRSTTGRAAPRAPPRRPTASTPRSGWPICVGSWRSTTSTPTSSPATTPTRSATQFGFHWKTQYLLVQSSSRLCSTKDCRLIFSRLLFALDNLYLL